MTVIVGIRFKDSGKTYYFDPGNLDLQQGDMVIVDTARGPEMAKVVYGRCEVDDSEIVGDIKPVLRHAEQADFERMHALHQRHDEVLARCAEKIKEHNLPMGLVKAEYSFDGSRLTFYFVSEQRVDFRMLVRDLARTFRSRIELRQIGPRDEAKLLGGIGPCGRLLCCATFLPDYARVSIKMAKDQDLPLNPSKISGVCGRLLCCLSYEHQQYVDMKAEMPGKGDWVHTPDGPGTVVSVNVLKSTVNVRLASSGMEEEYTTLQIERATADVHAVAKHRNEEGITPLAAGDEGDETNEQELLKLLDEENEETRGSAQSPSGQPSRRSRPNNPRTQGKKQPPQTTPEASSAPQKSSSRRRRKKSASAGQDEAATRTRNQAAPGTSAPARQEKPDQAQAEQQTTARKPRRRRKRKPSNSPNSPTSPNNSNQQSDQ